MIGILGQMEVLDQDKNVHSHQVLILVVVDLAVELDLQQEEVENNMERKTIINPNMTKNVAELNLELRLVKRATKETK